MRQGVLESKFAYIDLAKTSGMWDQERTLVFTASTSKDAIAMVMVPMWHQDLIKIVAPDLA